MGNMLVQLMRHVWNGSVYWILVKVCKADLDIFCELTGELAQILLF